MNKIAVFASGSGTNAENLIKFFQNSKSGRIDCILSNKPDAYVLKRAEKLGVETYVFDREVFYNSNEVLQILTNREIDLIVLAGFLWKVPEYLVNGYENRIVNIHPALLPNYGGKGMYGMNVHAAVIKAGDKVSGITIHYIDNNYDEGSVIEQIQCEVKDTDTPEDLANRIHSLEYEHYPRIIEEILTK